MVETILSTILFIVPGYVAAVVRRYWFSAPSPAQVTAESLAWSVVIYATLGSVPYFRLARFFEAVTTPTAFFASSKLLGSFTLILVFSAACGYLGYRLLASKFIVNILRRSPYLSVWDEYWAENSAKDQVVVVLLTEYSGWMGNVVSASRTPHSGDHELWLKNVRWWEDGVAYETVCDQVLIKCRDVKSVLVLKHDLGPTSNDRRC